MKKAILSTALVCLILLTSCSGSNLPANESQSESKTAAPTTETSVVTTASAESNRSFAPYKPHFSEIDENILNDNPIDKSFLAEESKHITTVDQVDFLEKYRNIWDEELEFTLKNLRAELTGSALKTLNDSQAAWQKYSDSESNLIVEVYLATYGEGSIIPILSGYKSIALIRERTLELKDYCYMATGDVMFKFK